VGEGFTPEISPFCLNHVIICVSSENKDCRWLCILNILQNRKTESVSGVRARRAFKLAKRVFKVRNWVQNLQISTFKLMSLVLYPRSYWSVFITFSGIYDYV
jgi:hypothetical protein